MATDTRRSSKTIDLNDTASGLYYNLDRSNQEYLNEHEINARTNTKDFRRRYSTPMIPVYEVKKQNKQFPVPAIMEKIESFQPNSSSTRNLTWEPVIDTAVKAIVSIKANHVRSFDTEFSGAYNATGFIVDAKRGIILTNRHVVSPAPIRATAILLNYEEIEVIPIYRDPVHDFGFLKFDPQKVKFMDLVEIPLAPKKARVGIDIRVVGNDAGEKLSILSGTLARLDRHAPNYGIGEYNDFNTFYYQAASGTSGGSSGSPVLDIEGNAIALNAGGSNKASSSYYLPLHRVTKALEFIKINQKVPRGTLLTIFMHIPYDEAKRLGLPFEIEEKVRGLNANGLLVVSNVLPKSKISDSLFSGDIVLKVNNQYVLGFDDLFEIIDNNVGNNISLEVFRGSKTTKLNLPVLDLHKYTPDRFVEIGGGVAHDLSYQIARGYNHEAKGVYVAASGYMFSSAGAWRKSIIVSVNHVSTPDLETFVKVSKQLKDGQRVPIKYYCLTKPHKPKIMIMDVEKHWHPFRLAVRNDITGMWDYTAIKNEPEEYVEIPRYISSNIEKRQGIERVEHSFVSIDFHIPYLIDGMKNTQFFGSGVIADKQLGLIVCDRDTIPIAVGDVKITFSSTTVVEGRIQFMHPVFNFVVVSYDTNLIDPSTVSSVSYDDKELDAGDPVNFVGISSDHSIINKATKISSINNLGTKECTPPRWRAINVEGIKVEDSVVSQGGVLCFNDGKVCALWANYSYQDEKGNETSTMSGLPWKYIDRVLQRIKETSEIKIRSLNTEFWTIRLSAAKALGLKEEWATRYIAAGKSTLFYVLSILNAADSSLKSDTQLRIGDIILECNGELVTKMSDINSLEEPSVDLVILRDGKVSKINAQTQEMPIVETNTMVCWMGAIVQTPNRFVLEQVINAPKNNVYVSCTLYGSPVNTHEVRPGVWIVEVEEEIITSMDHFIKKIKETKNSEYVKIKTISRTGEMRALSLKSDEHYWPIWMIANGSGGLSTQKWECKYIT